MAPGCPLHRLSAVLMVHLMSGLGMGEVIPDHEPSHPPMGRRGCPLLTQPQGVSEKRPSQGPSLWRRLCSSVPSSVPTCCGLPFFEPLASSYRKARGRQLMAEIPLVSPAWKFGAVSHLGARQRQGKEPRPGLGLLAPEAAYTQVAKATGGKRSQGSG